MFTISRTTFLPKLVLILFSSGLVIAGGYLVRRTHFTVAANSTDVPAPKRTKVNISRTGKTFIKVSDAISLSAENQAEQVVARPLVLGAADFDEDGLQDLATGILSAEGGNIRLQRGNVKAIFPDKNSSANELPFASTAKNLASEITPELMLTGDFDADGHADILVAARNNSVLSFFSGDGKGNFAEPQIVFLAGNVTALAEGEINRADGLRDFAVGINAPEGAKVLIFSSTQGAWASQPQEITLQHSVTALSFGLLTNDSFSDLAIAAGSEFVLLQGRSQQAMALRKNLPFAVQAMAVGNFSRNSQKQIGLLTTAGAVYLLQDAQTPALSRRSGITTRANWQPELFYAPNTQAHESISAPATQLLRTHLSNSAFDDLLVLRSGTSPVQILSQQQTVESNQLTVSAASEILAALPLRLNSSAQQGLVFIRKNDNAAAFVMPEAPLTFTVNSTLDSIDNTPGDGLCASTPVTGGPSVCTLRAAIEEANANAGPDLIVFNIGSSVQTITLNSTLPTITEVLTINAIPQGGAPANQVVVLTPSPNFISGNNFSLITATSSNNTIRGLTINNNNSTFLSGIYLNAGNNNLVEGNTIINGYIGVLISLSSNNTIGGTTAAARNIIGGNLLTGVLIAGSASTTNQILGNYIGTDVTGTKANANGTGIEIDLATNNTIGGTVVAARNIIAANRGVGIELLGTQSLPGITQPEAADGNVIQGNYIGVDATGTGVLGNGVSSISIGQPGILIDGASNTTIGGIAANTGNVIANNGSTGVSVLSSGRITPIPLNNRIQGNRIFNNVALGIDLGLSGVTLNDASDVDTGANNLQNFPALTSAITTPTGATITGTLNSAPNTQFTLEFFANGACDSSGYGEGEIFLGRSTVTTNANGDGGFTYTVSTGTPLPVGRAITATATDPNGNTSEFSACVGVQEVADLAVTQTVSPAPALSANVVTYTITITNNGPSIASFPYAVITTPSQLTNVTCTAPNGWSCSADGAFYAATTNFAPGTAVFTIRGTVACLAQDGILTATATVSGGNASDPNAANNISTLNTPVRSGTAVGTVTYDAGGTTLQLGPVVAGAVTTIPSGIFTLENTGCLPMILSTASMLRSGTTTNITSLDDSRLYVLRLINADNSETTISPVNNPVSTAPRLYNINRTLQPGQRLRYRVQFNPPLPLFAGKIGRANDGLSASQVLPDAVNSQLVFNFVAGNPAAGGPAIVEAAGDAGTAAANIIGRVSPAVQIVPREGFALPASLTEAQTEAAPLVILDRIRDEFRVGISLYDANRNITKVAYQFFDTYGQVASALIEVPLADAIASSGLLIGQPFSMVQAFTGAAKRPDVTAVRVTVTDGDGTVVSASSNTTASLLGLAQSVREPLRINFGDTIQGNAIELAPINTRRTDATNNRADSKRVIKIQ